MVWYEVMMSPLHWVTSSMSANPRMFIMRLDRLFPTNISVCKTYFSSISSLVCVFCPASRFLHAKMSDQASEHIASKYRYELLFGAWLLVTGGTFLKISKQPYSSRLKVEQYESIFKGTSLGAVLLGIGMTPTRSTARRFRTN
jgi:hypothetical protein